VKTDLSTISFHELEEKWLSNSLSTVSSTPASLAAHPRTEAVRLKPPVGRQLAVSPCSNAVASFSGTKPLLLQWPLSDTRYVLPGTNRARPLAIG